MTEVEMLPTDINGRWTLLLPRHRHERAEWLWWEKPRIAAMHDRIGPGDVVFDIGAEEGDLPCLWATWGATVHLFEPNARVWPNMKVIFEANGYHPGGWFVGFAGDVDEEAKPGYQDYGSTGWPDVASGAVIGDHGFCHLWERPDIPKVRVDTYVERTGAVPDVLTIDVEGSELRVLKGAEHTLREHQPTVFVSIHPAFMVQMYGEEPQDLHDFMWKCGYDGSFIVEDHEHHWRYDPR